MFLALEAKALGHGGIARVARVSGVTRATIRKGQAELRNVDEGMVPPDRARRQGGGRKRARDKYPGLVEALERLVAPETRGDPMSPLRWTTKSTRKLSQELAQQGFKVSHKTVAEILAEEGYSLQALQKTREGTDHPDRDAQFHHINGKVSSFLKSDLPVLSVDCKKKELVGDFKNGGREYQRKGAPGEVRVHDFVDKDLGKAIPYGLYDVGKNVGWVSVGVDHETAEFAVETLRRWWTNIGKEMYPSARQLLICADGGGSNGHRIRLWKLELARFSAEFGLDITVAHLPPGTSKWNKIEHRLFSYITMNWRGRPLVSREVILQLIASTTTREGLKVHAELNTGSYPTGQKVSDEEFATVPLIREEFHGDWNYKILAKPITEQPQ